jgi:hypothetical protein
MRDALTRFLVPSLISAALISAALLGALTGWLSSLQPRPFRWLAEHPWRVFWIVYGLLGVVFVVVVSSRPGSLVTVISFLLPVVAVPAIQGLRVSYMRGWWKALLILSAFLLYAAIETLALPREPADLHLHVAGALSVVASWAIAAVMAHQVAQRLPGGAVILTADGRVAGATASEAGKLLKRSSVLAVVLLSVIPFYISIWFLRRRAGLNALNSEVKLGLFGPVGILGCQAVYFWAPEDSTIQVVGALAAAALIVVLAFRVRAILIDHLAAKIREVLPVSAGFEAMLAPSSILTFFLNIWYLQYKINEFIDQSSRWSQAATTEAR